ncbi:hypothetical protein D3C75_1243140 [compost metagenome]
MRKSRFTSSYFRRKFRYASMINSGGNMEAAAVMLISVFINSCTLPEPTVGISISGITIKN